VSTCLESPWAIHRVCVSSMLVYFSRGRSLSCVTLNPSPAGGITETASREKAVIGQIYTVGRSPYRELITIMIITISFYDNNISITSIESMINNLKFEGIE